MQSAETDKGDSIAMQYPANNSDPSQYARMPLGQQIPFADIGHSAQLPLPPIYDAKNTALSKKYKTDFKIFEKQVEEKISFLKKGRREIIEVKNWEELEYSLKTSGERLRFSLKRRERLGYSLKMGREVVELGKSPFPAWFDPERHEIYEKELMKLLDVIEKYGNSKLRDELFETIHLTRERRSDLIKIPTVEEMLGLPEDMKAELYLHQLPKPTKMGSYLWLLPIAAALLPSIVACGTAVANAVSSINRYTVEQPHIIPSLDLDPGKYGDHEPLKYKYKDGDVELELKARTVSDDNNNWWLIDIPRVYGDHTINFISDTINGKRLGPTVLELVLPKDQWPNYKGCVRIGSGESSPCFNEVVQNCNVVPYAYKINDDGSARLEMKLPLYAKFNAQNGMEKFGIFHPDNQSRVVGLDLLSGHIGKGGCESPFGKTGENAISKYKPSSYPEFFYPIAAPEFSPQLVATTAAFAASIAMGFSRSLRIKKKGKLILHEG